MFVFFLYTSITLENPLLYLSLTSLSDCLIYYSHSYYTHDNTRYYYTHDQRNSDEMYHVKKHFFVTQRLARNFDLLQMMSQ